MKVGLSEERGITPKKAIAILEKHGYQISEEEAIEILDFLYILAKLTVNQYLKGGGNEEEYHENS